jgi:hypothetical protein
VKDPDDDEWLERLETFEMMSQRQVPLGAMSSTTLDGMSGRKPHGCHMVVRWI